MFEDISRIRVVDSHTGGEPTRIIVEGGPKLAPGTMKQRLEWFRRDYDHLRRALMNEPRGSEIVVGALLCESQDPSCVTGVIFFNNVGYIKMCGHGTIGLMVTLAYLGKIQCGEYRIDTPAGVVIAQLHETGEITVVNVPSYRSEANVKIEVPGYGVIHGDIAWGGNWFFLVNDHPMQITLSNVAKLTEFTCAIREALNRNGITGADGQEIDHIEIFSPSDTPGINSKNFVLCPGNAYDRSPCGTGTSAKLACLYTAGKLKPGEIWRQESIIGSVFEGQVRIENGQIIPAIKGSAFITAEADMILDPRDSFRHGVSA